MRASLFGLGLAGGCALAALADAASLIGETGPLSPSPATVAATAMAQNMAPQAPCPIGLKNWRTAAVIEGVPIEASHLCEPDNPYLVAAVVKGTNTVSDETLMRSGLSRDTVIKIRDGDIDRVEIHLEVAELNGFNPSGGLPMPGYEIAPGIRPGLWAFVPKHRGMSTVNGDSNEAGPLLRLPAPTIRIRVGDHLRLVLENTHYLPHTIHMHGVDHPFRTAAGAGNDGVPMFNEVAVEPGQIKIYEATPRHAGTFFYHCHVDEQAHVPMGLAGMFIVEERHGDDPVQTLNVGAGEVRYRSAEVRAEGYAAEYDLVYSDVLRGLENLVRTSNDPAVIQAGIRRDYNATQGDAAYFLLNGKSFPYTLRDSVLMAEPGQRLSLHVLNAGTELVAVHPHGHKFLITHEDGMAVPQGAQIMRDVVGVLPGQREDFDMQTTFDGVHADGPGLWMLHDHRPKAVTSNGMGSGGSMTLIAYPGFLDEDGMPKDAQKELADMFMPMPILGMAPLAAPPPPVVVRGASPASWPHVLKLTAMPILLAAMVLGIRNARPRY